MLGFFFTVLFKMWRRRLLHLAYLFSSACFMRTSRKKKRTDSSTTGSNGSQECTVQITILYEKQCSVFFSDRKVQITVHDKTWCQLVDTFRSVPWPSQAAKRPNVPRLVEEEKKKPALRVFLTDKNWHRDTNDNYKCWFCKKIWHW